MYKIGLEIRSFMSTGGDFAFKIFDTMNTQ